MCVSKRSHFEHWKIYWKNVRAFCKHDRLKLKMVGQMSYHPILIILHSALCVHLDPPLSIFLDLPLNGHLRSSPPALLKHLDQSTVKAKPPEAKPPEAMWGLVHQLGAGNDNIFAYQNVLVAKIKIFAQTVHSE